MLIREVAARVTHVAVIAAACCVGAVFLGLFLVAEIFEVCRPGWGRE